VSNYHMRKPISMKEILMIYFFM